MTKKLTSLFLFLAGLIPATSASAGLIAYWPFDEGAGTTAADATGGGSTGTLTGNPAWGLGVIGGALEFNGSAQYVAIENNTIVQLRSSTTYTVAAWVNIQNTAGGLILFHGEGCSAWSSWFLGVGGGEGDDTRQEGNLVFGVRTSNGTGYTSVAAPLVADTWIHVAATFDGSTLRLYIDGQEVSSVAAQQPYNNTNRFFIGGDPGCNGRNWLTGMIDDLQIYDQALSAAEIQAMQGNAGASSSPKPKTGTTDVVRDVVLDWKPGKYADTHDVYFGTLFDDVNNASRTSPIGMLASQGQSATTFDPAGLLSFGQTYYWRVDEVNAPPTDSTRFKGNVWSFTAEPYGYRIATPIKATASSFSNVLTGPEKTIDGSGLNGLDQHSTSSSQMWLSKKNVTPIWIQYEFDQFYRIHQMWVWNQNQLSEPDNGVGAMEVTIETSTDGTTWTALEGVPEFAQGLGEDTYVHNTTVDFGGVMAKFVKLTIKSNWGGLKQSGLSEVRFFYVPVKAFGPTPASGTTGVAVDADLNWRSGRLAVNHEVYLGTDPNALSKAGTVTDHRFDLASAGAEYDRTYYWRVNEVNAADVWEGDVWSFSTPETLVVDDFESYDDKCNRIFYAWADGYGASAPECGGAPVPGNGSGSTVGNASAPYAERTIIHGGRQSLPMAFDNAGASSFSEATRTFAVPQDWVQGGIKTLVLYFHGALDNAAGQIYVKINNTKVVYNGKADVLTLPLWKQWNIDLASVGGALRSVTSLAVGVSGTGKGIVYVDDLLLYRSAPDVVLPVDPGTTGLSAYYMMDGDVKDSSGKGYNGTLVDEPAFIDSQAGFGKALQLDGTNDYVELPIGSLIGSLESASFATWVNFDTASTGSWVRIFDFGTSVTSGNPLIYMFLTPRQGTTGAMRFAITTNSSGGEQGVNAPGSVPAGWHHVAVAIDGTAKTLRLFLDGEAVASGATAVLPKNLGVTNQNWLGRSQWSGDGYYQGLIDEFRIYNRALSEGEVRYLAGDR